MPSEALFDAKTVEPGDRLVTKKGQVFVVVENPGDLVWLFARPLADDGTVGDEITLFVDDVVRRLS